MPERNTGKTLQDIDTDKEFINKTSKAQVTKANIDKRNYIKPKASAKQRKRKSTE